MRLPVSLKLAPSLRARRTSRWVAVVACALAVPTAAQAETLRLEDLRPRSVEGSTSYRDLVTAIAGDAVTRVDARPSRPIVDLVRRSTLPIAPRRAWARAMPGLAPSAPASWDVSVLAGVVRRTAPATNARDDRASLLSHRAGTDDASDLIVVAFPPPLWIALIGLGVAAGARRRSTAL